MTSIATDSDKYSHEGLGEPIEVYGEKQTKVLEVDQLICVSQVRKGINPEQARLKESIKKNGLINQIDVAILSREEFEQYIGFVRRAWKSDESVDDYTPDDQANYYLVIAGHSRTFALRDIKAEGAGEPLFTEVKIYNHPSPMEILAIQVAENLSSQPAPERQAIGMVEAYFYGLSVGSWSNQKEFVEQCEGKYSSYRLRQALNFMKLPPDIREFVDAGTFDYLPAVELGRSLETVEKFYFAKYVEPFDTDDIDPEVIRQKIDALVMGWVQSTIAKVQIDRLKGARGTNFVKSRVKAMSEFLDTKDDEPPMLALVGFDEQTDIELKKQRSELERLARDMARSSMVQPVNAALLHARLGGFGGQEFEQEIIGYIKDAEKRVGAIASAASGLAES